MTFDEFLALSRQDPKTLTKDQIQAFNDKSLTLTPEELRTWQYQSFEASVMTMAMKVNCLEELRRWAIDNNVDTHLEWTDLTYTHPTLLLDGEMAVSVRDNDVCVEHGTFVYEKDGRTYVGYELSDSATVQEFNPLMGSRLSAGQVMVRGIINQLDAAKEDAA